MVVFSIEKFEEDMAVFSFKQHQDFLTYLGMLDKFGYTSESVRKYVEQRKREISERQEVFRVVSKRCIECNSPMRLMGVNVDRATQTGDPSDKSVWVCSNRECMETVYSKESVEEILKKGGT